MKSNLITDTIPVLYKNVFVLTYCAIMIIFAMDMINGGSI